MRPYGSVRTYHGCRTTKKPGEPVKVEAARPQNHKRERAAPVDVPEPEPLAVLMFGPPASGKGTQAKRLAKNGFTHLSTGNMLREAVAAGTPIGIQVASLLADGHLVSDEIVNALIAEQIVPGKSYLFDGYPRTVAQAEFLQTLLSIGLVVDLDTAPEVLVERIEGRFAAEGRSDDNKEAFAQRLVEYKEVTEPVLHYYRTRILPPVIVHIDGSLSVDEIGTEIDCALTIAG